MTAQDMSALMDGLVNEARSSRDSTFNALDAAERECRRNTQRLAAQVDRYVTVHESSMAEILRLELPRLLAGRDPSEPPGGDDHQPAPVERDTRFDPEDEWELDRAMPTSSARAPNGGHDDDDENDGYPDTWLR